MPPRVRWLLLSDIHFKHHDLDLINRTASWVTSLAEKSEVSRAVICGDLLTNRISQPTNVLSACYRFLSSLADSVPHTDIILGNHDLAYRRDYSTSALDALRMGRLAPYVSVHSTVGTHVWDGRPVMVLPFREEQDELVEAVAKLGDQGKDTVGFAHLAIHKAVLQKHIVRPGGDQGKVVRYRGFTGPSAFASLARTFTGHFHSHQTIKQSGSPDSLQGSITYLGSPLQLTWADLMDTNRGVVLFDPETLEYELVQNPHAASFTTADVTSVLEGTCDAESLADKHVMLMGDLSRVRYVSARDKLLAMGVRSVRDWSPIAPTLQAEGTGLGATALPKDSEREAEGTDGPVSDVGSSAATAMPAMLSAVTIETRDSVKTSDSSEQSESQSEGNMASTSTTPTSTSEDLDPKAFPQLDLPGLVQEYVGKLEVDDELDQRRDDLVRVGQRLVQISLGDGPEELPSYQDVLDPLSTFDKGVHSEAADTAASRHVFVAQPVSISITNFLGVQDTLTLDFERDLPRGLSFIIGDNGSGKSTMIEAVVWCLFGRCIRSGLTVGDVINDIAKKNCCVRMAFANGYAVTRYRKHKQFGNRVIVEKNGEEIMQMDKPDLKSTQSAIDELLGTDYETFVRTVVLGHENAASFLSASPIQRRELIESLLGLETMNDHAQVAGLMVRQVAADIDEAQAEMDGLAHTMGHIGMRLKDLRGTRTRFKKKVEGLQQELADMQKKREVDAAKSERKRQQMEADGTNMGDSGIALSLASLAAKITVTDQEIEQLSVQSRQAQMYMAVAGMQDRINRVVRERTREADGLRKTLDQLLHRVPVAPEAVRGKMVLDQSEGVVKGVQVWLHDRSEAVDAEVQADYRSNEAKLEAVVSDLGSLQSEARGQREAHELRVQKHQEMMDDIRTQIAANEATIEESNAKLEQVPPTVAAQFETTPEEIEGVMGQMTLEQAQSVPSRLSTAVSRLAGLRAQQTKVEKDRDHGAERAVERQRSIQAFVDTQAAAAQRLADEITLLRSSVAVAEQELKTYGRLIDKEEGSLEKLVTQRADLDATIQRLLGESGVFSFWDNAFSRRASGASSATFRGFVLDKCLDDLNSLFAQIITVLYEDTRHAKAMTTGILRSLFDSGDGTPTILDKSARVAVSLGYAKRSGGERKRIDLALFFALVQLSQARSAHRSRYIFVDEVFDSLDEAGQRAVVRWCGWMAQRLGWVLVVTHSQLLVGMGEGEEAGRRIRVRMGDRGTELRVEGK